MSIFRNDDVMNFAMGMTLLSVDPPIIFTSTTNLIEIPSVEKSTIEVLCEVFADSPIPPYFLISPSWHFPEIIRDNPAGIAMLRSAQRRAGKQTVIILGNEPEDEALASNLEFGFANVHQNAMVDESTFQPIESCPKDFDAIYNAKFYSFKQHRLALRIRRLCLLYAMADLSGGDIYSELRQSLPESAFLNGDPRNPEMFVRFGREDVNAQINRAKVGLALSPVEGAMYASAEYLFAGLPVVSIPNRGGRDAFAHPDHWITAQPDPDDIASAVDELIARQLPPHEIRRAALERAAIYRNNLVVLINRLREEALVASDWSTDWGWIRRYHGGFDYQTMRNIRAYYERAESQA